LGLVAFFLRRGGLRGGGGCVGEGGVGFSVAGLVGWGGGWLYRGRDALGRVFWWDVYWVEVQVFWGCGDWGVTGRGLGLGSPRAVVLRVVCGCGVTGVALAGWGSGRNGSCSCESVGVCCGLFLAIYEGGLVWSRGALLDGFGW